MAKKTIEEEVVEAVETGIKKIGTDFQRDDLNALAEKLNEVIEAVNNL